MVINKIAQVILPASQYTDLPLYVYRVGNISDVWILRDDIYNMMNNSHLLEVMILPSSPRSHDGDTVL